MEYTNAQVDQWDLPQSLGLPLVLDCHTYEAFSTNTCHHSRKHSHHNQVSRSTSHSTLLLSCGDLVDCGDHFQGNSGL